MSYDINVRSMNFNQTWDTFKNVVEDTNTPIYRRVCYGVGKKKCDSFDIHLAVNNLYKVKGNEINLGTGFFPIKYFWAELDRRELVMKDYVEPLMSSQMPFNPRGELYGIN